MIDRHHLLECILWPNGDGTFRKIVNTAKRLEKLGIYDDIKMTIPIERGVHQTMHSEFKKGTEYERSGNRHPMYGKKHSEDTRKLMKESSPHISGKDHPMYGRTGNKNPWYGKGYLQEGEKNPRWKGDDVGPVGAYKRARKLYKAGEITEEEFRPYRDALCIYRRQRKIAKKTSSDS